jgi:hypothetical protein
MKRNWQREEVPPTKPNHAKRSTAGTEYKWDETQIGVDWDLGDETTTVHWHY